MITHVRLKKEWHGDLYVKRFGVEPPFPDDHVYRVISGHTTPDALRIEWPGSDTGRGIRAPGYPDSTWEDVSFPHLLED